LSPETCRVKPLRRIKTQLLHLVGLISLLYACEVLEHCQLYSAGHDCFIGWMLTPQLILDSKMIEADMPLKR